MRSEGASELSRATSCLLDDADSCWSQGSLQLCIAVNTSSSLTPVATRVALMRSGTGSLQAIPSFAVGYPLPHFLWAPPRSAPFRVPHGWATVLNCWGDSLKINSTILNCSIYWGAIAHVWCSCEVDYIVRCCMYHQSWWGS